MACVGNRKDGLVCRALKLHFGSLADVPATNLNDSPGRYYAAAVMKVILAQIIMNYDFDLVQPEAPRWMSWRSTTLPRHATLVAFRARELDAAQAQ